MNKRSKTLNFINEIGNKIKLSVKKTIDINKKKI